MAAMALLLRSTGAGAAAYLPGIPDADPPTGETSSATAAAAQVPAGNGIRWVLAPLRYAGSVALDGRWVRLQDSATSTQALLHNEIDFFTYVWQPWFIQLRAGMGVLLSRDNTHNPDAPATSTNGTALTGRFGMSVFPASRFPFEARADVSDSRTRSDFLGTEYRSKRLALSQSYRPETGNDSLGLNFDYSQLRATDGGQDTVRSLHASAARTLPAHSFELFGGVSENDRSDSDDRSRYTALNARHSYNPASSLLVDTLATYNENRLHARSGASVMDTTSDLRQISSFATWRPREGEWLYSSSSPLYLTGSVRLVDASFGSAAGEGDRARSMNASLGATYDFTRELRFAGGVSGAYVTPSRGAITRFGSVNASATYMPESLSWGEWRYAPTLGANAGASQGGGSGRRYNLGAQMAHSAVRTYALGDGETASLNFTQGLGANHESENDLTSRSLSHSAGLFWQGASTSASQSFAGLSFSDSRTWTKGTSSFQLINLQFSRRTQLTRRSSWSGNLTAQLSRNDTSQIDPSTNNVRLGSPGWQRFYAGTLSYENSGFLGVPRLRYTALVSANSQRFERRELGDADAPRENITASLENRLDYAIGRLEAQLSARLVRIDGQSTASIFARVLRRY